MTFGLQFLALFFALAIPVAVVEQIALRRRRNRATRSGWRACL
jgi:hypothetical protein